MPISAHPSPSPGSGPSQDLPTPFPGALHDHWTEAARAKGFDMIARGADRLRVVLRCHACSGTHIARHFVVMTAQPLCPHCLESRWRQSAGAAGLVWLGRDLRNRHYGRYRLLCGHEARRQFTFVERIAAGKVSPRCEICLSLREEAEARQVGWQRLGRDPQRNPNYRLYRHSCGQDQRIAVANLRWGQCDCAGCGQSWTAKPSFIYLLDIRHPGSDRHYLKLGYSSHPVKRHRHQLGLPKDARVEVLRVVAMPTGHAACKQEKAAHAALKRAHPELVVVPEDYADLMNVVSEIYRPEALPLIEEALDRIEQTIPVDAHPGLLEAEPSAFPRISAPGCARPSRRRRSKQRARTRNSFPEPGAS